jgi:formylglycine-generating enzyme required for sulfatase activity
MVLIPGGSTWIGTDEKKIQAFGEKVTNDFDLTARENPLHERRVDDFFIGVTEVTNEQYLEYVKASGARPPQTWGIEAIDAASVAHATAEGLKKKETPGYVTRKFDQALWWRENWKNVSWAVPKGQETLPVVYVDHGEASGYARWAGVRLLTEFEFQRAGRGKGKEDFPWGATWDPSRCANQTARKNLPSRVGSFPAGATEQGVYDLCGNVWEWTASPFEPYPGFKVLRMEEARTKRIIDAVVAWDANQRVVVGGSFQHGELAARLTFRRPTERDQSAEALGFRVAASVTPGIDLAEAVLADDVPVDARPEGASYDLKAVTAADRWTSTPGTAKTEVKDKQGASVVPIPNYAVITGYDYLLFVPAKEIDVAALGQLESKSLDEGPVHLGVLSTTEAAVEPALPAGTYFVTFRGPGKLRPHESIHGAAPTVTAAGSEKNAMQEPGQEPGQEPAPEEKKSLVPAIEYPEGFDPAKSNLLFHTIDMKVEAVQPDASLSYARPEQPAVAITEGKRQVQATDAAGVPKVDSKDQPVMVEEPCSIASMKANAFVRVSNKGFVFNIVLKFPSGAIGKDWRR